MSKDQTQQPPNPLARSTPTQTANPSGSAGPTPVGKGPGPLGTSSLSAPSSTSNTSSAFPGSPVSGAPSAASSSNVASSAPSTGVQTFNNGAYAQWGSGTQPTNTSPIHAPTYTTPVMPPGGGIPAGGVPTEQDYINATKPTAIPGAGQSSGAPNIPVPQSMLPGGANLNQSGVQTNVQTGNVPGLVGGDALRQQALDAQQAAYRQASAYLDPQWQTAENQLRSQLVNQGIPQNSEAWNRSMDEFARNKQFAYQQAQSGAVQQGNAAQAQLFGQGLAANQNQFGQNLAGGQFTNAAQQQVAQQLLQQMGFGTQLGIANLGAQTSANQLAEEIAQHNFGNSMASRQQDINELLMQQQNPLQMFQALNSGSGVQPPNFTQTPGANVGGTDIASIIQQFLAQGNSVYNTQVGAQNSNTSAYAAIIAALLSDRRFKRNIRMIGMHEVGVPLYTFNYVWGEPGIGVMADELEKVKPHAVFTLPGGIKAVNYAEFSKVA